MSDDFEGLMKRADDEIARLKNEFEQRKRGLLEVASSLQMSSYDLDKLKDFLSSPYVVVPRGDNEWYVAIPRFLDVQVGWLEKQTASYNLFRVSRYTDWLSPLPAVVRDALELEPSPKVTVQGDFMEVPAEDQEPLFKRYGRYLVRREGRNKMRVRPRSHFALVASLVKDGILPFVPQPVTETDKQERRSSIQLRDYQQEALTKFLQFGSIGVFWMPSAGKTFFALYAMNMIRGKKLIVVPSLTLMEQWHRRIEELTQIPPNEYRIITYNSARKVMDEEFALVVYDECHHLPANVFSRLALIRTKYRIGLSATPYREDGRHELIFALTGFPVGLDWKHLMDARIVKKPVVRLILVRNLTAKISILDELVSQGGQKKTIVFCDTIRLGKQLGKRLGVQFVYGQTKRRLSRILEAPLIVVSRVGDEGISIDRLQRIIEFDFLFGSRRQELQRLGRLFHSAYTGEHIILMTEEEFSRYRKRLFAVYEKGIDVTTERR